MRYDFFFFFSSKYDLVLQLLGFNFPSPFLYLCFTVEDSGSIVDFIIFPSLNARCEVVFDIVVEQLSALE